MDKGLLKCSQVGKGVGLHVRKISLGEPCKLTYGILGGGGSSVEIE